MALADFLDSPVGGRYWAHLGIEVVESRDSIGVCRVLLREHHLNYNDIAHGGVVASLIDSAAGAAVRSVRSPEEVTARPHATSDLHVSYLAAARGTELVARARVLKAGRTVLFTDVEVTDDTGRMIARGSVTLVVGAARPANEA